MRLLLAHNLATDGEALGTLLNADGFDVCEVGEWQGLEQSIRDALPHILVLDCDFCSLESNTKILGRVRHVVETFPGLVVVVRGSASRSTGVLWGSLDILGVSGYVSSAVAPGELISCVRRVAQGGVHVAYISGEPGVERQVDIRKAARLSPRQREVLELVARGLTTKEIAVKLNLSVKTIESHRSKLMEKVEIHELAGLVRFAVRIGLVVV